MNSTPREKLPRVLFLTSSAPRFEGDPTAPFVLNMARDLSELGWRVEVLAPHAHGLKRHEVMDGVVIRRFRYLWPSRMQTLCYNGGAAVNMKLSRFRKISVIPFVVAEFLSAFARVLRYRPSIIHSHWVIPQGFIGQLLSFGPTAHVISVHGTDVYGFQHPALLAVKAWVLRRCTHVIANSSATRATIEKLSQPKRLSVIPTGAAPTQLVMAPRLARSSFAEPRTALILFVGRLIEAKGVAYLLHAMPRILRQREAMLLIVGDGPERNALEREANELGISQHCTFVGSVPHQDVGSYFSVADVFVGPSVEIKGESTEAQGNTFVEALFARTPVVATRVGGIPDAIIHEKTGLLIDERSSDQISASVLRILSDPCLADHMRHQGYAHASEHFSRQGGARKIDAIYRHFLRMESG